MDKKFLLVGFVAGLLLASTAFAQTVQSGPIHIIVPVAPAGLVDASIRTLGPKMSEALGRPVIIENRPGAGGIIGMAEVARSRPDGHTLLFYNDGIALAPFVFANPGFDTLKDFSPITQLFSVPFGLFVHPSIPVRTLQELVAYSKTNAGKLSAGSGGAATGGHLFLESFKSASGADIQHIPYKGAGPALTDFIAGQTQVFAISTTLALPQVRAGKARPLAVASAHRASNMPEVPTTAEAGYPGVEFTTWIGIFAPANMSAGLMDRIRDAALKALNDPANLKRFADQGLDVLGTTPDEFRRFVASEHAKFGKSAAAAGIKPE